MKFFALGLGIGSAAGVALSYLRNPENNRLVKDDVKTWFKEVSSESQELATSLKNAKLQASQLESEIPQVNRTLNQIQKRLNKFQKSIEPNISNIKKDLNSMDNSMENLK